MLGTLLLVIGSFLTIAYGAAMVLRHKRPSFYNVALSGCVALFLSFLFSFVQEVAGMEKSVFSLPILGQMSAYLFFGTANLMYIPPEWDERGKKPISLIGFIGFFLLCAIFFVPILQNPTWGNLISQLLRLSTLGYGSYMALTSVWNKYQNPIRKAIAPFNIALFIVACLLGVMEILAMTAATEPGTLLMAIKIVTALVVAMMMPLLRGGLKPWEV